MARGLDDLAQCEHDALPDEIAGQPVADHGHGQGEERRVIGHGGVEEHAFGHAVETQGARAQQLAWRADGKRAADAPPAEQNDERAQCGKCRAGRHDVGVAGGQVDQFEEHAQKKCRQHVLQFVDAGLALNYVFRMGDTLGPTG